MGAQGPELSGSGRGQVRRSPGSFLEVKTCAAFTSKKGNHMGLFVIVAILGAAWLIFTA